MTVFENDGRWDTSNVESSTGRVVRYEKGLDPTRRRMRWIDYGLSVLARDRRRRADPRRHGRPTWLRLLPALAAEGALAGFLVTERFYEIGSPAGLAEVTALLEQRTG